MEKFLYKLSDFEGPLDLLLNLIFKNKLNIYDIEISILLAQYMEHIDKMKENDMDVASEFLEMAARLVYIKTVSLLPKHEESEELKKELAGELIEYQECKKVAEILSANISFNSFVREPDNIDFDMSYKRHHKAKEIFDAYLNVVGRARNKIPVKKEEFSNIISRRVVSVSSKIVYILKRLFRRKELKYYELFKGANSKSDIVATFLAVLELIKGRRLHIDNSRSNIIVKLVDGGVKK